MTFEINHACPFCGRRHDAATLAFGDAVVAPSNGDVTMCFDCGEFAIYDNTVPNGTRKPTDAEYGEFGASADIKRMRDAWVQTRKLV